jgi:hypothetical protein
MSDAGRPPGCTALIAALWISVGFTALYWVLFFTSTDLHNSKEAVYLGFERAFPAADAWLAVACVICAEGLRRRRGWATLFGVAAGSAFIYLGLMDTLYNLEHGMYAQRSGAMLAETTINLVCFVFGPLLMAYVWRHRKWLGV